MIISRTPVRVSFCGGGTDLDSFAKKVEGGGMVISVAIAKYIHVTVNDRFDSKIRLSYSKLETTNSVEEIEHDLVREALKATGVSNGVEITTIADIPSRGTGLGSSSAVTVGVLNALYKHIGRDVSPGHLAEGACEIEIDKLGEPIGRQDQYAAAFGGMNRISFNPDGVQVSPITLSRDLVERMEREFSLVYTNNTRSASAVLSEPPLDHEDRIARLRAIRDQAAEAEKLIRSGDLKSLGALLHETWNVKRGLSPSVSNDNLDTLYARLIDLGANGGKLLGAGGGGFFLIHGDPDLRSRLVDDLPPENRVIPLKLDHDGSRIIHPS
tara:strand:+ start:54459 stop:55436 length:978 start_codon:yes stop_codon:yes gene_type:complete